MAYIIYKNGDEVLTVIDVGEIDDTTTSLTLLGKNVNNYGEYFNNNFVKLLTNFADNQQPVSPQVGQIWFDTTAGRLKVYDGTNWDTSLGSYVDSSEPTDVGTGEFWFNDATKQTYAYDGTQFWLIGPHTPPQDGLIGFYTATFNIYDYNVPVDQYYPSILYSRGEYIGMISDDNFTLDSNSGTVFYSVNTTLNIVKGLTIFHDLNVRGTIRQNGSDILIRPRQESSYYDITRFGLVDNVGANTVTNKTRYDNGNLAIASAITKVFPPGTNEYPVGSSCKVVCDFKKFVTLTTVTNFYSTGTLTVAISTTTSIQSGLMVNGSWSLYPESLVAAVAPFAMTLTNATISHIVTGTIVTFSTVTTSIRHFTIIDTPSVRWAPLENYTGTSVGVNLGNFTMTNIIV
ncbi:MAG: hypothetical protein EBU90_04615 [Proteobacteria bacterium]|nr:hypothetical protein [Pseudomonadota bacterium]NBP13724.1 hypothetical protein [bacterium]